MARRIPPALLLAACALTLAGCVIVPPMGAPATPAPTTLEEPPPSEPTNGDALDCDGGFLLIDRPGDYRIGACDEVELNGTGIDLTTGDIGTLTIRGDDNDVTAASVGTLTIQGQDNDVDADRVGSVEIAGNDNDVDSRGDVGAVRLDGNENSVEYSGQVGAVDDRGHANEVRPE